MASKDVASLLFAMVDAVLRGERRHSLIWKRRRKVRRLVGWWRSTWPSRT